MIKTIINFILSLFGLDKKKDPVLSSLEKKKEDIENKLEDIEDEEPTNDDLLDHFNDK